MSMAGHGSGSVSAIAEHTASKLAGYTNSGLYIIWGCVYRFVKSELCDV
jgi:hypothetical protein